MSLRSGCVWGSHQQFAELYESFLDAVYPTAGSTASSSGRELLASSIAANINDRGGEQVLDCAAGTGFPAIDLARLGIQVHCSDGDPAMLAVLARQAEQRDVSLPDLIPPRRPGMRQSSRFDGLVLDWNELESIPHRYDYVLCRGNSLAYADTWADENAKAADHNRIATHLDRMVRKVKPGGYLHVDAPWNLDLPTETYRPVAGSDGRIWEEVTPASDHRQWVVSFKGNKYEQPVAFSRVSSLLTIDQVASALKLLGLEETEPFHLDAERWTFGTIIARKPRQRRCGAVAPCRKRRGRQR